MYEGHIWLFYFDQSNSLGKNNFFKNDVGKIGYPIKSELRPLPQTIRKINIENGMWT